jgi:hypothetical protein
MEEADFSTTMGWRIRTVYGIGILSKRLGIVVVPFTMLVLCSISGPIGMLVLLGTVSMISISSGFTDIGVQARVHDTVMMQQSRRF